MPAQSLTGYTRVINWIAIFIFIAVTARALYLLRREEDRLGHAVLALYAATATVASALVVFGDPPVVEVIALHSLLLVFEVFVTQKDEQKPWLSVILLRAPTLAWASQSR